MNTNNGLSEKYSAFREYLSVIRVPLVVHTILWFWVTYSFLGARAVFVALVGGLVSTLLASIICLGNWYSELTQTLWALFCSIGLIGLFFDGCIWLVERDKQEPTPRQPAVVMHDLRREPQKVPQRRVPGG